MKKKRIAGEGGDGWLWQKVGVGLLGEDDRRGEEKKMHQEEEEMLVLNSLLSLGENKINNKIQQISHPHI